jgi:hypothetical protein
MDEDLTDKERENFAKSEGKTIDDELYEKCLYVKTESEQIADLMAFGFDVSRLGVTGGKADVVTPIVEDGQGDEELGF